MAAASTSPVFTNLPAQSFVQNGPFVPSPVFPVLPDGAVQIGPDMLAIHPMLLKVKEGHNPRTKFPEAAIKHRAETIRAAGEVQKELEGCINAAGEVEIVDGEIRKRSCEYLLTAKEPFEVKWVRVHLIDPATADHIKLLRAVTANDQLPLSPLDQARAIQRLFDAKMTQEQIAKALGDISTTTVRNRALLLTAPEVVQQAVENGSPEAIRDQIAAGLPITPFSVNDALKIAREAKNSKLSPEAIVAAIEAAIAHNKLTKGERPTKNPTKASGREHEEAAENQAKRAAQEEQGKSQASDGEGDSSGTSSTEGASSEEASDSSGASGDGEQGKQDEQGKSQASDGGSSTSTEGTSGGAGTGSKATTTRKVQWLVVDKGVGYLADAPAEIKEAKKFLRGSQGLPTKLSDKAVFIAVDKRGGFWELPCVITEVDEKKAASSSAAAAAKSKPTTTTPAAKKEASKPAPAAKKEAPAAKTASKPSPAAKKPTSKPATASKKPLAPKAPPAKSTVPPSGPLTEEDKKQAEEDRKRLEAISSGNAKQKAAAKADKATTK